MGHIQISSFGGKILKYFNEFGTFQSHCKSEHNQVK